LYGHHRSLHSFPTRRSSDLVSMMIAGRADTTGLARDTVFAAVMIVCNGIVGLCLLAGGLRHHEQVFHLQGAQAALSVKDLFMMRSEEHTSELQSRGHLVCRL